MKNERAVSSSHEGDTARLLAARLSNNSIRSLIFSDGDGTNDNPQFVMESRQSDEEPANRSLQIKEL
jgi:hypothetical protein